MEDDSDSVFDTTKRDDDYNPFRTDDDFYDVDPEYEEQEYTSFDTNTVESGSTNNMDEKLLPVPQTASQIKKANPYYLTGAYDDEDLPDQPKKKMLTGGKTDWSNLTEAELDEKEREIREREKKVRTREKELEEREKDARLNFGPPDNWPCGAYPIAYHDINEEIPGVYQPLCRKLYGLCLLTFVTLPWNWLCLMAFWMKDYQTGSGPFIWGTIFMLVGVPGAWKCWYRNIYNAFKSARIRNWFSFFFWFFCHTCFCIAAALGIPGSYLVGFVHTIDAFNKTSGGVGFMALICAVLWIVNAWCSLYWIRSAWRLYQTSGKSSSELLAEGHRMFT